MKTPKKSATNLKGGKENKKPGDALGQTFIKQKAQITKPCNPLWCQKPIVEAFYERHLTNEKTIVKGVEDGKYL